MEEKKRECGGCTACCKTHGILEIWKMPGEWCHYCQVGQGCIIYATRPEECQTFQCAWLQGVGEPKHRPDLTGVVPDYRPIGSSELAIWFFEIEKGELQSEFTRRWTKLNLCKGNCVVHISLAGQHTLYLSEKKNYLRVKSFSAGRTNAKIDVIPFPLSVMAFL